MGLLGLALFLQAQAESPSLSVSAVLDFAFVEPGQDLNSLQPSDLKTTSHKCGWELFPHVLCGQIGAEMFPQPRLQTRVPSQRLYLLPSWWLVSNSPPLSGVLYDCVPGCYFAATLLE